MTRRKNPKVGIDFARLKLRKTLSGTGSSTNERRGIMGQLLAKIEGKNAVIAIFGLGYIGLSLTNAFTKCGFKVIGYDIDTNKIASLKRGENYLGFLPLDYLFEALKNKRFIPTAELSDLKDVDVFIVSVPTPLNSEHQPEMRFVKNAVSSVASKLIGDELIIFQSTSYPGTTEEVVMPILEKDGFKVGESIFLAHVPEREDAGTPNFDLYNVPRLIGGVTPKCSEIAATLYKHITKKIHICSSAKIAEAAKVFENTYRLINIAFVDEMKEAFDHLGIDIMEVIDASSTKPYGFTRFVPGPGIGGECIPVDPVYLANKIKANDGPTTLIEAAEVVNARAPYFVLQKVIEALNKQKKCLSLSSIFVIGVAFKKDVSDIRESPALKVMELLLKNEAKISYYDPFVQSLPRFHLESTPITEEALKKADCLLILTDHSEIDWQYVIDNSSLVVDTRQVSYGIKKGKEKVVHA